MIKISFNASRFNAFLDRFKKGFRKTGEDELSDTVIEVKEKMSEPGKPITYPVQWDSEKQRRFVIAKLAAEGNLPYRRQNDYISRWKIAPMPNGLSLSNQHPAGAIGGTLKGVKSLHALGGQAFTSWQSKIHRGRWRALLPTLLQALADMPKRVIDRLKVLSK